MVVVKVCVGSACYVKSSHDVINMIRKLIENNHLEDEVELKAAFCLGHCTQAVCVMVDDELYSVQKEQLDDFFNNYIKEKVKLCK